MENNPTTTIVPPCQDVIFNWELISHEKHQELHGDDSDIEY